MNGHRGSDTSLNHPEGFAGVSARLLEDLQVRGLLLEVLDILPDATFMVDREKRVVAWNKAMEMMTGVSRDQMIGKGDHAYAVPFYGKPRPMLIDLDEVEAGQYDVFVSRGNVVHAEATVTNLKGCGTRYLWGAAKYLVDDQGVTIGAVETIRDITDRKLAARELSEERERFRTLTEHAPVGIVLINQGGFWEYMNPKFRNLFGYTLEDVPDGKNWFRKAYPDPEYRRQVIGYWTRNMEKFEAGEKNAYVFEVTCRNGTLKTVNFIPVQLPSGGFVLSCEDVSDYMSVQRSLRESEARYRSLIENAVEGIFQTAPDGRFLSANPAQARIHGYSSPEELISQVPDLGRQLHVDPRRREEFERLMRDEGLVREFEAELYRRDGSRNWVTMNARAVRDENGDLVCYEGILQDITDRKEMEETLRQEMEKFAMIVENAPLGIVILGADLNAIEYLNPRFTGVFGYTIDEIPSNTVWAAKAFPEGTYREYVLNDWSEYLLDAARRQDYKIYTVCCKDGDSKTARFSALPLDDGRHLITCEDITERVMAEEKVRESEMMYRALIEMTNTGYLVADPDGNVIDANQEYVRLSGHRAIDEIRGRNLLEWIAPADKEVNSLKLKECGSGQPVKNFVVTYADPQGETTPVEVNAACMETKRGIEIIALCRDIKERYRLESLLRQSQKLDAIGQLAGGVAHDFNNILSALMGYTGLIQMEIDKETGISPERKEPIALYLSNMLYSIQRAAKLTHGLLAFGRKQFITPTPVSLNECINHVKKMIVRLLTEDIEFRTILGGDDPVIMADPTQMDQIFINLVTNARDAMPQGGTLVMETGITMLTSPLPGEEGDFRPGRYAVLSVSDSGTGIDQATRERIFDPFFTTKEAGKGTGLGLATVYGIVKQHQGHIEVASAPKTGTTFRIYFPLVRMNPLHEGEGAALPDRSMGGRETILVAEDEPEVRRILATLLGDYGYTVLEAADGQEAVEAFAKAKNSVNIVLLDVVMPKLNGRQVYEKITSVAPWVKVLFMSGHTDDIIEQRGLLEGRFDFVRKPGTASLFLTKIREILDRK